MTPPSTDEGGDGGRASPLDAAPLELLDRLVALLSAADVPAADVPAADVSAAHVAASLPGAVAVSADVWESEQPGPGTVRVTVIRRAGGTGVSSVGVRFGPTLGLEVLEDRYGAAEPVGSSQRPAGPSGLGLAPTVRLAIGTDDAGTDRGLHAEATLDDDGRVVLVTLYPPASPSTTSALSSGQSCN